MSRGSGFEKKPIPWLYSQLGSMLGIALLKLHPIHRNLMELEIRNICDYFNSDFVTPGKRQKIGKFQAFWMAYWGAIRRITKVSRKARQDYYALQRRGAFCTEKIPVFETPLYPDSPHLPLLIVPGLNTPPAFFREMYSHFAEQGYNVSVLELPEKGLADVETAAQALKRQIDLLKSVCKVEKVNVIGHCLGGLVAQYYLEALADKDKYPTVNAMITLGTGFLGAEGVEQLKNLWIPRNPGRPVPKVFDQLIQWNVNVVLKSSEVACHSLITVWDFMVHFRNGILENAPEATTGKVSNHILEDPDIDHLTLALHPRVFEKIESLLAPPQPQAVPV